MPEKAIEAVSDDIFLNIRTDTYALLGALLRRAPDADLLCRLQDIEWHPAMQDHLIDAWRNLRDVARQFQVQAVEKEYQLIFEGLGQGEVVPYASWYLEGLLMGQPLARLRHDLVNTGIARCQQVHEAEDHAGLLCETMALLGLQRDTPIQVYARFFGEHISSWMFDFFADLQKAPSAAFYRKVAGLGFGLLEAEQVFLKSKGAAYAK